MSWLWLRHSPQAQPEQCFALVKRAYPRVLAGSRCAILAHHPLQERGFGPAEARGAFALAAAAFGLMQGLVAQRGVRSNRLAGPWVRPLVPQSE